VALSEDGHRELTWPTTSLLVSTESDPKLSRFSVLIGTEPARRWKSFVAEVIEMIEDREIETVIFLGGMLADTPHTRPIAVTATSQNLEVRKIEGVEKSSYEGPVGIVSDLADQAFAWERGIDEIAENDEEMAGYIEQLEASRDEVDSEAASGEAIARELEKFLESEQRPPEA
jgi:hypothetical protein